MVNRLVLLVFMMLSSSFCFGQIKSILLWGDTVPAQTGFQQDAVISENHSGDVLRIAEVTRPLIEAYTPNGEADKGIAVLVCPGGGYNILALDKEGREVAQWLTDLGYHAFVLQYRVPKNRGGAFMDVQRAIRLLRSLGVQYGFADWKVGVMGFSAGGHLSARAATAFHEISYAPMDDMDQFSARPDFAALIYPAYLDDGPERALSEDIQPTGMLPPIFIFGTADDGFGNDAIVMAQSLRDQKQKLEFHLLASGGHGYGLRPGNPAAEAWPGLLAKWLTQFD